MIFGKVVEFLKKRRSGVAALEAAFAIPAVVYVIFFTIELVRLHNAKIAMDSMALQCTLDFIASKSTANFENVISKHSTLNLKKDNISYYFRVYKSLGEMCADGKEPFGAEEVYWPSSSSDTSTTSSTSSGGTGGSSEGGSETSTTSTDNYIALTDIKNPCTTEALNTPEKLSGKVFVLTFVYNFDFSSGFIKGLFGGGVNSKDGKFLLWGRGVGVCD